MNDLCRQVLRALHGKTLSTAESCTGGGIGTALTAVPGCSAVYKGGVICYCNEVKERVLGADSNVIASQGAVSAPVAQMLATGVRELLRTDYAVSVTGLAGPDGDEYAHPVGTVYIGVAGPDKELVKEYHFSGDREVVRLQAVKSALTLLLENL